VKAPKYCYFKSNKSFLLNSCIGVHKNTSVTLNQTYAKSAIWNEQFNRSKLKGTSTTDEMRSDNRKISANINFQKIVIFVY